MSVPVVVYQRYTSPALDPRYRYTPNCSTYALQAIHIHEPIKELIFGT